MPALKQRPLKSIRGNFLEAWMLRYTGRLAKKIHGAAFLLAGASISGQLRGSRQAGQLRENYRATAGDRECGV